MTKLERVFKEENTDHYERRGERFELPSLKKNKQKEFVKRRVLRRAMQAELDYIRWKQET
jgi:ribosomal protein S21